MSLSKSEEQLMQILWEQEKAYMNDLIAAYPDPKPAQTTIATLLKRMRDKGFVEYTQIGRAREYYPLVAKESYFSKQMRGMIQNFFDNSATQFASFFAKETDLSKEELESLRSLIDREIKNK